MMQNENINRRSVLAAMGLTGAALAAGQLASRAAESPRIHSHDVRTLESVAQLHRLEKSELQPGRMFAVAGYYAGSGIGGGVFRWDASVPRANHNGATVISPTVPWDGALRTHTAFLHGEGETEAKATGCFVKLLLAGHISYDDFGAPRDGKSDATAAVRATHMVANAEQIPVAQHNGKFLLDSTGRGIVVQTSTDLTGATIVCTHDANTVTPRVWTYLYLIDQDVEEVTAQVKQDELAKGVARIPSLAGRSGMISLKSPTSAMMRWGRTPTGMREPHTIGHKNGELNKPLYLDFARAENVQVFFKPWVGTVEFRCPQFEFSATTSIRALVKVARNNVRVLGMKVMLGEQEKTVPIYTPIDIQMCADVEVDGLYCDHVGKPAPEQINAYLILMTDSIGIRLRNVRNYSGWSGINGNYFADLSMEDFAVHSIGGHAYVRDLTFRNGTFYQHCLMQGMGLLRLENVTHENIYGSGSDRFIYARQDYGASWDGDIVIRDCRAVLSDAVERYIICRSEPVNYDPQGGTFDPNLDVDGFTIESRRDTVSVYGFYGGADTGSEKTKVLPEKIRLANVEIKSSSVARFSGFWSDRKYSDTKLPAHRGALLRVDLQNIHFPTDPKLSREDELAYAVSAIHLPTAAKLQQKISVDNVANGGLATRGFQGIQAVIKNSTVRGGWRVFGELQANIADNASSVSFQNCKLLAPENGVAVSTVQLLTEYSGCTFAAEFPILPQAKPVTLGQGAETNAVRFSGCVIEKPARAEDSVSPSFAQKVLRDYKDGGRFITEDDIRK